MTAAHNWKQENKQVFHTPSLGTGWQKWAFSNPLSLKHGHTFKAWFIPSLGN